jgi:hypothetical protein
MVLRLEKTKTVRLIKVVQACGTPSLYLPFDPEHDKAFKNAVANKQVATIKPSPFGKAPFASVGYTLQKNVTILVFPKTLSEFAGMRIVGIDYSLVEGTTTGGSSRASKLKKAEKDTPPKEPALRKYVVEVKVLAQYMFEEEVEAASKQKASELIADAVAKHQPDFSEAEPKVTIGALRLMK